MEEFENELQDDKIIAERAEKDLDKCYETVGYIAGRAVDGRITIVDKKDMDWNEVISDEYIEKKIDELLDNIDKDDDFRSLGINLWHKEFQQGEEEFVIYYPRNSPFRRGKKEEGLFNININVIDSVARYVEKIIESRSETTSYYRGQNDWKYDMEPGIYRENRKDILKNESRYIREIVSMYPQYFKDCKNALDYLSVLQHNGFPTRLLDFTENPLVALYMACCSDKNTHADVIELKVANENIKFYDSDTVAILSNIAWYNDDFKYDEKESKTEFNKRIGRLIHQIRNEKPYFQEDIEPKDLSRILFVKSKHNFERISQQSGLFALFGIEGSKLKRPEIERMEGIEGITHYIIPASLKGIIISELDCLGINQASLYCDLGNISQHYINNFPNNKVNERNKKKNQNDKNPFE